MQKNPLWSKSGLSWFLIFLLIGGSAQFAYHAAENTFAAVISYISFGIIILFWVSYITMLLSEATAFLIHKIYGCKLAFLRVFGTVFVNENGRFKRRKMAAIEFPSFLYVTPSDRIPLGLWLFGSMCFVIVLTLTYLALAILLPKSFWTTGTFLILFFKEATFLAAIPWLSPSPFALLRQLKNDEKAKRISRRSSQILGLHLSGTCLLDMPDEWFELPTEEEFAAKPLVYGEIIALGYSRLTDEGYFKQARELAELSYNVRLRLKTTDDEKNMVRCDFLLCVIMDDCDLDLIAEICGDDLISYIKGKSEFIGNSRLLYLYELFVNKDAAEAEKRLAELEKLIEACPFKAIADSERRGSEFISKKFATFIKEA
jgi:hypothetical protein